MHISRDSFSDLKPDIERLKLKLWFNHYNYNFNPEERNVLCFKSAIHVANYLSRSITKLLSLWDKFQVQIKKQNLRAFQIMKQIVKELSKTVDCKFTNNRYNLMTELSNGFCVWENIIFVDKKEGSKFKNMMKYLKETDMEDPHEINKWAFAMIQEPDGSRKKWNYYSHEIMMNSVIEKEEYSYDNDYDFDNDYDEYFYWF